MTTAGGDLESAQMSFSPRAQIMSSAGILHYVNVNLLQHGFLVHVINKFCYLIVTHGRCLLIVYSLKSVNNFIKFNKGVLKSCN